MKDFDANMDALRKYEAEQDALYQRKERIEELAAYRMGVLRHSDGDVMNAIQDECWATGWQDFHVAYLTSNHEAMGRFMEMTINRYLEREAMEWAEREVDNG